MRLCVGCVTGHVCVCTVYVCHANVVCLWRVSLASLIFHHFRIIQISEETNMMWSSPNNVSGYLSNDLKVVMYCSPHTLILHRSSAFTSPSDSVWRITSLEYPFWYADYLPLPVAHSNHSSLTTLCHSPSHSTLSSPSVIPLCHPPLLFPCHPPV